VPRVRQKKPNYRTVYAVATMDLPFLTTTVRTTPNAARDAYLCMHPGNRWSDLEKETKPKIVVLEVRITRRRVPV
jgi:hypothetical protein